METEITVVIEETVDLISVAVTESTEDVTITIQDGAYIAEYVTSDITINGGTIY